MKPVLVEFYGFAIHSYGLMLAIAFIVGVVGVRKTVGGRGIDPDAVVDLGIWILVGAVVGARIAYVITEYRYFVTFPLEIFQINSGGLAFHGGLIGGFGAGIWYTKRMRLDTWMIADRVAPFIALGYSIVRIGCLLNGCCYGRCTSLPWALRCAASDSTLRHPTQVYAMAGSLILFGILWKLRDHKQFTGFLFVLYIALYSVLRFIVEYFREGPMIFPWLSLAQGVCILMGGIAFVVMGWQRRNFERRRRTGDAGAELHH